MDQDENDPANPAEECPSSRDFRPGDHVWMHCEAIGGVRYQHHGIVVKVLADGRLSIADFTAPNESTIALPTSSPSTSQGTGGRMLDWHGVRIVPYDAAEWHKERYTYEDDDEAPPPAAADADANDHALQRVTFLLQNPHLLPKYELLESNCETVAVWCRTGQFRTHQVAGLMGGGIRNSAVATGVAAAASVVLGPLPAVVGAGVVASMSLKQSGNESKWRERTEILNEEFDKWRKARESRCVVQ